MNKQIGLFLLALLCSGFAQAFNPFQVKDIKLEGIERVEPGVIFRNFPINSGDTVTSSSMADATKQLFRSGYFEDIKLKKDGDVIVVQVKERPAISKINLDGNKVIKKDDLIRGLKESGLREGDVFKRSTLDRIRLDLLRLYVGQGRYGASIKTDVQPVAGNRVALNIKIKEGSVATIQHINIIGNTVFSDEELKDLFSLKLPSFWSFYTKDDRYAREKLSGDLERLTSHYMDQGYINFKIDSTDVSITPDKKSVFITVSIHEGDQYTFRDIKLAGDLVLPEETLLEAIPVKKDEVFSRKLMSEGQSKIAGLLGNEGYIFANVSPIPELHEEDKSVSLKYFVEPGQKTYVRRINIQGNSKTADAVIRREMQQMESAIVSIKNIERSKERLERTGYFKSVNLETTKVPGTNDQVDLNYSVEEQQSGQFTASLGYSQSSGVVIDLGVQQDNFFGSGNKVGFSIARSATKREASFNYLNPFYTLDGVSRGFDVFYREYDFEEDDISSYSLDEYGAGMNFGYPIDEYQRLGFSLGIENIEVQTNKSRSVVEILDFVKTEGDEYLNIKGTMSWSNNHLNRGIFPTKGYSHRVSLEVAIPGSDLSYYKAMLNSRWYMPISNEDNGWVVGLKGSLGYADAFDSDKKYPFFKHFFAGGLQSVRGYENNSLGPRDSNNDPFGGNVLITSSAELIFPLPFIDAQESWRTLFFADAGNVFTTKCLAASSYCTKGVKFNEIRYTAGIGMSWLSPLGPLSFSVAKAFNEKPGDEVQSFQFSLGSTF